MASASAILATRAAVARVSAPDMENVSTINVIATNGQAVLIRENTASCPDAQASVPALITASVIWKLRSVYALKDGPVMIAVRPTVLETPSVLAMEAAATPIQEGAA